MKKQSQAVRTNMKWQVFTVAAFSIGFLLVLALSFFAVQKDAEVKKACFAAAGSNPTAISACKQ